MPARHTILCINVGSSSCKFALYSISAGAESLVAEGAADRIGSSGGKLIIHDANGRSLHMPGGIEGIEAVAARHPVSPRTERLRRRATR